MKHKMPRKCFCLALPAFLLYLAFPHCLYSLKSLPPSAKTPTPAADKITVAVLYPSLGSIKDLLTLRQHGLIDIPNLAVLGVYHGNELTDYQEARDFVAANRLDWITFYPLSAPLSADTLFQKNPCSVEFEKIFEQSDGIIFFGGPDIPPRLYKEKTSLLTVIEDPYRHFLEVSFIFHLLGGFQDESFTPLLDRRPQFPILGICLGCQSLNVGAGGTLTQDICSEIYGKNTFEDVIEMGEESWHHNPFVHLFPQEKLSGFVFHAIKCTEGGKLCKEIGFPQKETPLVFSSHHQQVENLGKGLKIIATSLDGKVAEAIEHTRYPYVLGVQFHPEAAGLYDSSYHVRFTPQEAPHILATFLKEHPSSWRFHQELWSWVARTWVEYHQAHSRR